MRNLLRAAAGLALAAAMCFQASANSGSTIATGATTRAANTTVYTANSGWALLTSGATYGTILNACRANGGYVTIPQVDVHSSANPATKLQGIIWLFDAPVATPISDNATFTIASADYANITGPVQGFPFTLASNQAAGAANSGASLLSSMYHARCQATSTNMFYMIQVVNAYTPASNEVLTIKLHTVAAN